MIRLETSTTKKQSFWSACETLVGPAAVEYEWKRLAGEDFEAAKVFLQPMQNAATRCPCMRPCACGCNHRVIIHGENDIEAVCDCTPLACESFHLTKSDIILYELNRAALCAAIIDALSLEPSDIDYPDAHEITQVGFYRPKSGAKFPVFLAIFTEPEDYRSAVSILAARNSDPFIVIVPTGNLLPPDVHETLSMKKADVFTLSDMLAVDDSGQMSAASCCKAMLTRFRVRALDMDKSNILSLNGVFFYSPDFRCVLLNDREFTLTPSQAHVIQILCEAYRNGTPDISKDYIMVEIGSSSDRLRDIFNKDNDVFYCLIRLGNKRGTYRLNIDPE
ncbi:MAG: hypothetical protein ABFD49_07215 [Armatimonadota bacterium]|nr:hypothetical protein [bacterium]